ncbi:hypothetical protein [Azohydromonas australica]|uniref:hypothetical protein n=1 Tax=Azohydromonas australica TaxID=364039 RepID=UPI0004071239|nr:hypothetical protein [Azohydromonas australica]
MQSRRDAFLVVPEARFYFDAVQDIFFADFSGCVVRHLENVEQLRASLLERLAPLGKKVPAIVNYEGFSVSPDAWDAYVDMAREVAQAHYSSVSRYTGGAFLRARLGRAFQQRGTAAHVFGTEQDARKFLCCTRQGAAA